MDTAEIEKLHDRAVGLYVEGRYAEARQAWEQILSAAPGDGRASEGIRMVSVLCGEFTEPAGEPGTGGNGNPAAGPVEIEVPRIGQMLRAGRFTEAAKAARALLEANPSSDEIRSLARRAEEMFEAEPFISAELAR